MTRKNNVNDDDDIFDWSNARRVNFKELPGYSDVKPDWYIKLMHLDEDNKVKKDADDDFEDDDFEDDDFEDAGENEDDFGQNNGKQKDIVLKKSVENKKENMPAKKTTRSKKSLQNQKENTPPKKTRPSTKLKQDEFIQGELPLS